MKAFSAITPADLRDHPVWEFANDVEHYDSLCLRPLDNLPITDFGNRIVGTVATLANGDRVTTILQNVDLHSPHRTDHLVTLTLFNRNGESFPLARYHDIAIDTYGPDQLAAFLGLTADKIFPISYDISDVAIGDRNAVRREVPIRPRQLLTQSEIIDLAMDNLG